MLKLVVQIWEREVARFILFALDETNLSWWLLFLCWELALVQHGCLAASHLDLVFPPLSTFWSIWVMENGVREKGGDNAGEGDRVHGTWWCTIDPTWVHMKVQQPCYHKFWPWEVHFIDRTGLLGSHSIWLKLYVRFVPRTTQEQPEFQLLC